MQNSRIGIHNDKNRRGKGLSFTPFDWRRYKRFLFSVPSEHQVAIPALRVGCKDKSHVKKFVSAVLRDGGEGVILRKPKSHYEHGRSANLVKIKASNIIHCYVLIIPKGSPRQRGSGY